MVIVTPEELHTMHASTRLTHLPTYVFAWLDELKEAARARGASLIDLGMGIRTVPPPSR